MSFRERCNFLQADCDVVERRFPFDEVRQNRFICVTHRTFHLCNGGKSCLPIQCKDEGYYCAKSKLSCTNALQQPVVVLEDHFGTGARKEQEKEEEQLLCVLLSKLRDSVCVEFSEKQILDFHRVLKMVYSQFSTTNYDTLTNLLIYTLGSIFRVDLKKAYFRQNRGNKFRYTVRGNKKLNMIYRVFKNHDLLFSKD